MSTQPGKNFIISRVAGVLFAMLLTVLFSLWLAGSASAHHRDGFGWRGARGNGWAWGRRGFCGRERFGLARERFAFTRGPLFVRRPFFSQDRFAFNNLIAERQFERRRLLHRELRARRRNAFLADRRFVGRDFRAARFQRSRF